MRLDIVPIVRLVTKKCQTVFVALTTAIQIRAVPTEFVRMVTKRTRVLATQLTSEPTANTGTQIPYLL